MSNYQEQVFKSLNRRTDNGKIIAKLISQGGNGVANIGLGNREIDSALLTVQSDIALHEWGIATNPSMVGPVPRWMLEARLELMELSVQRKKETYEQALEELEGIRESVLDSDASNL
jgi:hypothetical protein